MGVAFVAFNGTNAHRLMLLIKGQDVFSIASSDQAISELVASGSLDGYAKIIAMGLKNRSKDTFVHVEQVCFRHGQEYKLDTVLADGELFRATRISKGLERSWCNKLAVALKQRYMAKPIAFLHVPPAVSLGPVAIRLREHPGLVDR